MARSRSSTAVRRLSRGDLGAPPLQTVANKKEVIVSVLFFYSFESGLFHSSFKSLSMNLLCCNEKRKKKNP